MLVTLMEPYDFIFGTVRPVSAVFVDDNCASTGSTRLPLIVSVLTVICMLLLMCLVCSNCVSVDRRVAHRLECFAG